MQLSKILAEIDLEISRLEQARSILAGDGSPAVKKTRKARSENQHGCKMHPVRSARRNATFRRKAASESRKLSASSVGVTEKSRFKSKSSTYHLHPQQTGWDFPSPFCIASLEADSASIRQ